MTVLTVHSDAKVTKDTTFQRSLLGAILNEEFDYTAVDESEVVLASADTTKPQYVFYGRLLGVGANGALSGIVERIEIFANAMATDPSVVHVLDGEQLLADIDLTARQGSGPLASQNYGNFYGVLGSQGFGNEIHGSNGPDTLETLFNTSLVKGFGGSDVFLFYGGVTYDGGKGTDFLDISASGRHVAVDLKKMLASDGDISNLISIEGVIGGDNDDTLTGNGKKNALLGNGGDDDVNGGGGKDRIFGNFGNDNLKGGAGDDSIFAGAGDDTANGGNGNDLIDGGRGNDELGGGSGSDELKGRGGRDRLHGGLDEDKLNGGDGDDVLFGEADRDTLFGGEGGDALRGGSGSDILNGNAGRDRLAGGPGNDDLFGGRGPDKLFGEEGDDDLWGQGGGDRFVFSVYDGNFGSDTIHDFKKGFDHIRIFAKATDVSVEQQGQHTNITVAGNTVADTSGIQVLNVSLGIGDLEIIDPF